MTKKVNQTVPFSEAVKSWSQDRDIDALVDKVEAKCMLNLYPGQVLNTKMSRPNPKFTPKPPVKKNKRV